MSTLDHIKEAISTLCPTFHGEVSDATTAADVEGWDSVTHVQIIFLLEDLTGKSIDLGRSVEIKNVGDLIRLVDTGLT